MNSSARRKLIDALVLAGFGVAVIVAEILLWNARDALGPLLWWLQLPLGFMTLAATLLSRAGNGGADTSAALRPASLAQGGDIESVRAELARVAERIEERDRELTERLKTFHEWLEFPKPLSLADAEPDPTEARRHTANDKQLFALLENESRRVFDRVLKNAYTDPNGQVQAKVIRDEALDLVNRIARIYQPDAKEPLLETSVSRIFHAASRASLQFLVVFEELPLAVKDYTLQDIYDYVAKGVKAYGVYKQFEPYKPYVDTAYYLGRFAMGASPLTLGAWWVVGALGQKGLEAVTTHYLEGQALAFLHNLIRVVGYEVAGLYGGDFRHRDPNWFYAVEVVELVHTFPASRRSLARALKEIGRLTLRSEYDRVFLYRALAAHGSVEPDQYDSSVLSATERAQIAERLELLLHEDVPGARANEISTWHQAVERRLNVKVRLDSATIARRSAEESSLQAVRSLAGFLIEHRELEADRAAGLLERTRSLQSLAVDRRTEALERLRSDPPFFFEPPDLDPGEPAALAYLADLTALSIEVPPFGPGTRELIGEVAAFLRHDAKKMTENFNAALLARQSRNLSAFQPEGQLSPAIAEALAIALDPGATIQFVYSGISIDPPLDKSTGAEPLLLCAIDQVCTLRRIADASTPLWTADETARGAQKTTLGQGHCAITGGHWADHKTRTIRVDLPLFSGYAAHFQALLERIPPRA
jgi:hypothetical protein